MGFYSRHVFPWLMDRALSHPSATEQRPGVLSRARGDVLEVGFGTGLNLPHYPPEVRRLVAVEPNPGARRRARRRLDASGVRVEFAELLAGRDLPFDSRSFDSVVSTWTLCSIADVAHALVEVHRVLRAGGSFLFIEHGLSPDEKVARWQRRLDPIQKRLGDGCHLTRDIAGLIEASPMRLETCDRFYLRQTPRVAGFTYRGTASREG
jgi:SAM-dependent methyltransferase